jgi:peroxiredoxin
MEKAGKPVLPGDGAATVPLQCHWNGVFARGDERDRKQIAGNNAENFSCGMRYLLTINCETGTPLIHPSRLPQNRRASPRGSERARGAVVTRNLMTRKIAVTAFLLLAALFAFADEEQAICAVCGPREGAGPEEVKAHATHKGKSYAFCSLKCKVEFLKNPEEFLVSDEGKPAPPFTLKTFGGSAVSLDQYRGKVVLLDFWGTFCIPCINALPELQSLHAKNAARGFTILGVTVDDRKAMVEKAVTRAKVTYPIVQATPAVWGAYKVNSLPSLVLVGRDGRIVKRFGGEADRAAMLAEIERAIAQ